MAQRHIWIIRHGKSDHGRPGLTDHDRTLNPRGKRDGDAMQVWLANQPHRPEWIWASSAVRAQETAKFVERACNAQLLTENRLYLSMPDTLLDVLRATPDDITSVAVVAHNPGLTYLVNQLGQAYATDNLVTWGVGHFVTPSEWPDLQLGGAELFGLHTPKQI